ANAEINNLRSDPYNFNFGALPGYDEYKQPVTLNAGAIVRFRSDPIEERVPPFLRIGINYFSENRLFSWANGVFSKKTIMGPFSQSNNNWIDIDSISTKALSLIYRSENINLESDFLISTNQDKFISGYCGAGAIIGLNYNGKTIIKYHSIDSVSQYTRGSYIAISGSRYNSADKEEALKNKPGLTFGVAINFGIELRILKKLRLFIETKPIYRANKIHGYTITASNVYQFNFGLKYCYKKRVKPSRPIEEE
ncbi:MAG: hypothetical protein ABIP51_05315, partial [Bacteroidia bacterium]